MKPWSAYRLYIPPGKMSKDGGQVRANSEGRFHRKHQMLVIEARTDLHVTCGGNRVKFTLVGEWKPTEERWGRTKPQPLFDAWWLSRPLIHELHFDSNDKPVSADPLREVAGAESVGTTAMWVNTGIWMDISLRRATGKWVGLHLATYLYIQWASWERPVPKMGPEWYCRSFNTIANTN